MKPLTANLKTLYQFPRIWLFHCILMIGILMLLGPMYIRASLLLICWYGLAIGSIIRESLRKPFAFCLSGHVKEAQRMSLLVWLAIIIVYTLLFFMDLDHRYALFVGSIGLISLSFWSGVIVIIPKGRFISVATMLIILLTFRSNQDLNKIIEYMPLAHAWAITSVSGILSYLIYRAVGSKENARRLCSMPWLRSLAASIAKQEKFRREYMRMSQDHKRNQASVLTGFFFSEHIRSNQNSTLLPHLWGQVYLTIGPLIITRWRVILIGALCILIISCFPLIFPPQPEIPQQGQEAFMIYILASVAGGGIFTCKRFDNFLLIGRREYLWRGIVFLVSVIVIVLGFAAASVLLFYLLSGSLLPFLFNGISFSTPIGWKLLLVLTIMIPLYGGLVILLRDRSNIILMVFMIAITVGIIFYAVNAMENTPFMIDLLIILSAAAITWGFHLAVLYYESMKRSLCRKLKEL